MIHYSTKQQIQDYFDNPALDQSMLKRLLAGPSTMFDEREQKLYFEEKDNIVIGSLVDALATHKPGTLEEEYYISTLDSKPSDTLMSIVKQIFDANLNEMLSLYPEEDLNEHLKDINLSNLTGLIEESIIAHNYQPGWKMETKVNKILEQELYFEELKNGYGKNLISYGEYSLGLTIFESLRNLSFLRDLLSDDSAVNPGLRDGGDIYFQYPMYFTYKGVECKGLIDILYINKKTGKAIIFDIKTTAYRTLEFFSSVMKFRYDIQLGFYRKALMTLFPEITDCKTVLLVESTNPQYIGNPVAYLLKPELLEQAEFGSKPIEVEGRIIKKGVTGFSTLMDNYLYYLEHGFDKERILVERGNVLALGVNGF